MIKRLFSVALISLLLIFPGYASGMISGLAASGAPQATDCETAGSFSSNGKLLIHSDHTDASQDITDSGPSTHTISVNNQTQHDTAQSKIDSSSIKFDGTDDTLTIPTLTSAMEFTGNFTVAFWVKMNRDGTQEVFFGNWETGDTVNQQFLFRHETDNKILVIFQDTSDNNLILITSSSTVTVASGWTQIAFVRNGSTGTLYIGGSSANGGTDASSSGTIDGSANDVAFGAALAAGAGSWTNDFNGWIDEVIVTEEALWTTDFTPPTRAWCD
jgi:hypothetical protein